MAGPCTGNSTAAAALERAQMFDQAGDEQACMDEVSKAQGALAQQHDGSPGAIHAPGDPPT